MECLFFFFAFLLAPTEMVVVEKIDKKTWGLSGDFKYLSIKKWILYFSGTGPNRAFDLRFHSDFVDETNI